MVDHVRLRERLEGVAPDDRPQGGLGDLVDRRRHVLDRDDQADRVVNAVVGDGRDVGLTLSRVMIPWDWIGIVTIRSQSEFRTGWFIESLATQTLVVFVYAPAACRSCAADRAAR